MINNQCFDINQTLQGLLALKNAGRNPQQITQLLIRQNPQIQQAMIVLNNMSQGKDTRQFLSQLARQNGLGEQGLNQIMQIIGG